MTGILPALAGANVIYGLGMLEMGITFDLAQLVWDHEIAEMILHSLKGVPVNDTTLAVAACHDAIRKAVGNDYPVLIKMNCGDFIENGLILKDALKVGKMLAERGIDAIELSETLHNIVEFVAGQEAVQSLLEVDLGDTFVAHVVASEDDIPRPGTV